jgi:hypothetical protein
MQKPAETVRRELHEAEAEIARLNRELGLDLEAPAPAEPTPERLAIHERLAVLYRRAAELSKAYAELYRRGEV